MCPESKSCKIFPEFLLVFIFAFLSFSEKQKDIFLTDINCNIIYILCGSFILSCLSWKKIVEQKIFRVDVVLIQKRQQLHRRILGSYFCLACNCTFTTEIFLRVPSVPRSTMLYHFRSCYHMGLETIHSHRRETHTGGLQISRYEEALD